MKIKRILAVCATASLLTVAACGGGGTDSADEAGGQGTATEQSGSDQSGSSDEGSGGDSGQGDEGDSGQGGESSEGGGQPSWGVPPTTDPLPMPEKGKRYDNPQPRKNIKNGGVLKLPIAELGPNFNGFSVDGNTLYVSYIKNWIAPDLWDYSVGGKPKPNPNFLTSAKLISKKPEKIKYVINKEATWNNGDPITWKAFKTTWITQSGNTDKYNPAASTGYSSIKSVEMGDNPKEVIVTMKKQFYPWQIMFSGLEHPKNQDPKFYKKGWVNDLHPELGAGPFTVASLTKNKLVLKRNPKWWGDKAKLDKVIYTQMEDQASINAFVNGEIDSTSVASKERLEKVRDMDNILIRRGFATDTSVFTLQKYSDLFKDKAGRKAFVLSINRKQLAKIEFQGLDWEEEPPGSSLMYPWMELYEDNIKDLHYSPDEANKILEKAGWKMGDDGYRHKNGKTAKVHYVWFSDSSSSKAEARAVQQMAKQVGIKVELDNRPGSEFSKTITETKDYDVVAMGWSGSDPYGWLWGCQIYCSDSGSNFSGLGNEKLDKMLKKPTTIPDLEKAAALGNKAESKALHLFGLFPLWNGPVMRASVKGLANTSGFIRGLSGFYTAQPEDVGWMTDKAMSSR